MPVVSAGKQARPEGYFRLEWRLADQRTHLMGRSKAFLLPVCVDTTKEAEADVPESFLSVQWTRLPAGETPAEFCARVKKLLGGFNVDRAPDQRSGLQAKRTSVRPWLVPVSLGITMVLALAFWQPWKKVAPGKAVAEAKSSSPATPPHPAPPSDFASAKSIAVLPFENLSDDKGNGYFSDGVSEELLNVLGKVPGLKVSGRTSSFYFKGKQPVKK